MTLMARDADLVVVFETHATSLDNEAGLASGWFDVTLSATGEEQARQLGTRRRDDEFAAVFCSDLVRASRTAEIAFGNRALPIVRDAPVTAKWHWQPGWTYRAVRGEDAPGSSSS
jgi:broad specificity phosphatase PhoE